MNPEFMKKLAAMRPQTPRTIALAAADDAAALSACAIARDMGFAHAQLFGPKNTIEQIADKNNINMKDFEIIDIASDHDSAASAVKSVRDGHADILMKGHMHTADILRAVLNKETGIRGPGKLSHVSVLYSPTLNRTLMLTDVGMVMYPDLATKVALINNAVAVAHKLGIQNPAVVPLAAVETINPAMQATLDADALTKMNQNGEITGCRVFGPLAFDGAVSKSAADVKGIKSDIAGNADILVFHNIEAANSTVKSMTIFGGFIFGGIIMGATAPIVINSRSDSNTSKLYSIALACATSKQR